MTNTPPTSVRPLRTAEPSKRHGRWSRLCLKELRETLRDRRTLITLVLMPLLVYPVLSMVFQRSLMSTLNTEAPKVLIAVSEERVAARLFDQLRVAEQYINQEKEVNEELADNSQETVSETRTDEEDIAAKLVSRVNQDLKVEHLNFRAADDIKQAVLEGRFDLGIRAPHETKSKRFELIYREGSAISQNALRFVEERLLVLNEMSFRQRLSDAGLSPKMLRRVIRRPLQVEKQTSALSTIVPMILILMTVTGAVYPAIDLTAGERERGTLEMLMASPVPRFRLLLAKYVAVVTVAFLTALVNLTAMTLTLWATGLSEMLLGNAGLGPVRILQILALLVLFAAFFSAVLLSLTSFARSFKEAQAYLVPLMLLSLGPGVVSLLPGLELNGLLAITPISNIVLLARDLCGGAVNPIMASAAIFSTGLYTLASLGVAAKIFGTDAVMSGSNPTLQGLLHDEVDGRLINEHRVSTVSGALLCLAVLFPIYFVLLSGLGKLSELPMAIRLAVSGVSTSFLFGFIPLIAAKIQRLNLKHSFQLFASPLVAFTTALMLGFTVWPVVLLCVQKLTPISADKLEMGKVLLEKLGTVHPALILVSMAIIPAIFEELFFRGYLFSALKAATNAKTTIVVSAVLFGLFHVVSSSALTIERLLPSTLMGLILGWLCYRCGSVFPGMILHACHNGVLTMMAHYKDNLDKLGWGMDAQTEIPIGLLAVSGVSVLIGIVLIATLPKRNTIM